MTTKQGKETSEPIKFNKGLPQGDTLCPTIYDMPYHRGVATQLKVFAASVEKMKKAAKESMKCRGKQWNEKKCSVKQKKRGALDQSTSDMKLGESSVIVRLKNGEQYKECENNLKQEDKLVLKCAAEVYL